MRSRAVLAIFVALALVATACGDDDDGGSDVTIRLARNNWSGSAANVAVAKNLLENQLDLTVEVVDIDENAQWASIASGDLHASLEVWPSGHADNVASFIDGGGGVVNAGLLGPVGKISWYIPTYMVDQNPELKTYEGFQNPELAALFATAETGDRGQFLGGDPSFVQYDGDIITNLGMDLEVVFAGSEEALLGALDAAYTRQDPILFYFWTPHSVHNSFDLTAVELPAYSDECYATPDAGTVDCDYPEDVLFKIAWDGLQEASPDAFTLLSNLSYSTADQISMIAEIDEEGKTADEAAASWIAANESVWQAWLPS